MPRRCWCEAAFSAAELFRRFAVPGRPAELSLFCDAAEDSMLASVFTEGAAQVPLRDYFDALLPQIPSLRGRGAGGSAPRPAKDRRAGRRRINRSIVRLDLIIAWIMARSSRSIAGWWTSLVECVTGGQAGRAGVGSCSRVWGCLRENLRQRFERVVAVESAPAAMAALDGEFERDECDGGESGDAGVSARSSEGRDGPI